MNISIIQTDLTWENKTLNLDRISALIEQNAGDSDLVVLPEMFTTGFSMNPAQFAERMDGQTVKWMKEKSSAGKYAICGSTIIEDQGKYFNRLLFVTPDGKVASYDKRHLHSMSGEQSVYTSGKERVCSRYGEFGFNLQVCYDLRFPVWSRNDGNSDVIIYSANWPGVRSHVWKSLLIARAIENQCYVIGANRIGSSPDGTTYSGDSLIIGPKGETLASLPPEAEGAVKAHISREFLDQYRKEMPIWRDADSFTIDIT